MKTDPPDPPDDGQQPLFDLSAANAAGEHGRRLASAAERVQAWKEDAAHWLSRQTAPFTADDLVAACGLPDEGQNRNNVIGATLNGAAQRRMIVNTQQYRKSKRVLGHGRVVAIWRPATPDEQETDR